MPFFYRKTPPSIVFQGVLRFSAGFASGACTAFATQWMHNVSLFAGKIFFGMKRWRFHECDVNVWGILAIFFWSEQIYGLGIPQTRWLERRECS